MRRLLSLWQVMIPAVVWVAAAGAQPPPNPGPPNRMDPGCVGECRQDVRTCTEAVRAGARLCAETCAEELAAVEAACADDPGSEECRTARADARTCLIPCAQTRGTQNRDCRKDARTCLAECRDAEPPADPSTREPACAQGCASVLRECLSSAREKAAGCPTDNCSELLAAVGTACEAQPGSADCRQARQDAFECLRSCRDGLRQDTGTCVDSAQSCVGSCPPSEEEPDEEEPE